MRRLKAIRGGRRTCFALARGRDARGRAVFYAVNDLLRFHPDLLDKAVATIQESRTGAHSALTRNGMQLLWATK